MGIDSESLLDLGRNPYAKNPDSSSNMAYLAIDGSAAINGLSRLHGTVSQGIFSPLFPHCSVPLETIHIFWVNINEKSVETKHQMRKLS